MFKSRKIGNVPFIVLSLENQAVYVVHYFVSLIYFHKSEK